MFCVPGILNVLLLVHMSMTDNSCAALSTNPDATISKNNSACLPINDCAIYNWLIDNGDYGVIGFPKEQVDSLLKKDECTTIENDDIQRGTKTILNLSPIYFIKEV